MITVIKRESKTPVLVEGEYKPKARFVFSIDGDTEKPILEYEGTLIAQASYCIDVDNVINYIYNEGSGTWTAMAAAGSDSGSGSGGGSGGTGVTAGEIVQLIALAMGSTPVTRVVVEDAADTVIECDAWDKEYVVPGTSLESLTITLPETTPTALSSCIKVTILGITRYADPEDDSEDPLLLPPTIILPDGLYLIGGYPEFDGDRWCLTIDNDMTATAMVIPAPPQAEEEEQNGGE